LKMFAKARYSIASFEGSKSLLYHRYVFCCSLN
jgi:hypothetical protein